ncbi:hypothetical protein BGZ63DRAFT_390758 [Mariannaea sp. PMI_226]|nr:hypothetical protein BGZ63DRAFT_390758 [Mariannaea sp. PMI_226]
MKLSTAILGLFGLLVAADIAEQRIEINVGNTEILDVLRKLEQAKKSGNEELASQLLDELKIGRSSKQADSNTQWTTDCKASAYLDAEIFAIKDPRNAPEGIKWAMDYLDKYWTSDDGSEYPYPGDFKTFMHRDGFRVISIRYDQLPWAVREWREQEMEKGLAEERKLIAVLDGVAFFAPGAMTWLMPLFAGADLTRGKDACHDELLKLDNYHNKDKKESGVKYIFKYGGTSQVGTTIRIQTTSQRLVADKGSKEDQSNQDL